MLEKGLSVVLVRSDKSKSEYGEAADNESWVNKESLFKACNETGCGLEKAGDPFQLLVREYAATGVGALLMVILDGALVETAPCGAHVL